MTRVVAILLVALLSACATSSVVYLANNIGDMARCGPYPESASNASARAQVDQCIADYQMKGYRTIPSPNHFPAAF